MVRNIGHASYMKDCHAKLCQLIQLTDVEPIIVNSKNNSDPVASLSKGTVNIDSVTTSCKQHLPSKTFVNISKIYSIPT